MLFASREAAICIQHCTATVAAHAGVAEAATATNAVV
jgi:hypothetical protein